MTANQPTAQHLAELSAKYKPLEAKERIRAIFSDFDRVLITSSFGTTAAVMLHMLKEVKPGAEVHFIDTKYHFKETYEYARQLCADWNLSLVLVNPPKNEHSFTEFDYTWLHEPDACCHVNKVLPLEELKQQFDVWVSGMFAGTSATRQALPFFKQDPEILRFYPFADMTEEEANWYRIIYEIPSHPLEKKGYSSIGCEHCTRPGEGRSGRWAGTGKVECGLHQFSGKN